MVGAQLINATKTGCLSQGSALGRREAVLIGPPSGVTDRNGPHHDRRAKQPGKSGSDLASIDQQIELRFELKLQVLAPAGLRVVVTKRREFCLEAPEGVQGFAHAHVVANSSSHKLGVDQALAVGLKSLMSDVKLRFCILARFCLE